MRTRPYAMCVLNAVVLDRRCLPHKTMRKCIEERGGTQVFELRLILSILPLSSTECRILRFASLGVVSDLQMRRGSRGLRIGTMLVASGAILSFEAGSQGCPGPRGSGAVCFASSSKS